MYHQRAETHMINALSRQFSRCIIVTCELRRDFIGRLIYKNRDFITTENVKLPAVHGAMGCSQKSFKLVWRCHQLLSGFLAKGHLSRVSCQSRFLANDKGDYEIRGLCTDFLSFALQLWKISSWRSSMKAVRPFIASNGIPCL